MSLGRVPVEPIDDPVDAVRAMASGTVALADQFDRAGEPVLAANLRSDVERERQRADRMERERGRRQRRHWQRVWAAAADTFEQEWRAAYPGE